MRWLAERHGAAGAVFGLVTVLLRTARQRDQAATEALMVGVNSNKKPLIKLETQSHVILSFCFT